ncbi:MAG: DUF948 domain-containing protein [Candidatus Fermentibacteraceae bacterium]
MSATAIVLLVGVAGFWVMLVFLIVAIFRIRKTLETLEQTMDTLTREISEAGPRLSAALSEVERSGEEIRKTASRAGALVGGITEGGKGPMAVQSLIWLVPTFVSAFQSVRAMIARRRGGGRE